MLISRDARTHRRRRLLRESVAEEESSESTPRRRAARKSGTTDEQDGSSPKRSGGYSQDVRRACGQRLVQLIPVRRRSFAAVILVSLLLPSLLLAAHYLIYVSGQLQWYGHPLALVFNARHSQSIAAWLSSQLWLLCLGTTVLTFQLRRHKLDDYNGEYRLWFWLVVTCLLASFDATTHATALFGMALDRWSQMQLGWSGAAIVEATLAVLIGLLGLRLCSELKAVPLSLIFWLMGLFAWAGSAALGRPEFKIEMSLPFRYWLVSALWLGGLTAIWLAALTYLRHAYVDAQRRFLARGPLATSGVPLGRRLRESLPNMPTLPGIARFQRSSTVRDAAENTPLPAATSGDEKKSRFSGWLRKPKDDDEADEYRKLTAKAGKKDDRQPTGELREDESLPGDEQADSLPETGARRRWLPSRPKLPAVKLPRMKLPTAKLPKAKLPGIKMPSMKMPSMRIPRPKLPARPRLGSLLSVFRLPKFKLPSLRLPPPEEMESTTIREPHPKLAEVNDRRPLPNTAPTSAVDDYDDDEDGAQRSLSKAERKRLRRQQQQQRRSA
ncbi:MAG: hypothetical protein KDA45_07875 [Planctomycetales bacterium]|nr:hypothetical protein [Planctomycetales bacterium]